MSDDISFDRRLLIIGCGGHSKVVTDVAEAMGFVNISYLDRADSGVTEFLGREVLFREPCDYADYFFVAIGDNAIRERIYSAFRRSHPSASSVVLVHPSSVIASRSSIGPGSVVMPLCVINRSTVIGEGVIVNTRASVDHDNELMDFSSVAPGVTLGGNVIVGQRSAVSIGASIMNGIRIGRDVVVGASSFVRTDVEDNAVVYGVPAKYVRDRQAGDPYL